MKQSFKINTPSFWSLNDAFKKQQIFAEMKKEIHGIGGKDNGASGREKLFAVITGASRGIGLGIARKLASHGLSLIITGRDEQRLKMAVAELKSAHPLIEVHAFAADLSKKEGVEHLTQFILAVPDLNIEVLVNNAGVFMPGTISDEPEGNFETQWQTNVASAYYLTRALMPHLKQRKSMPHIFNICSTASIEAYPNGGSYCISKFALLGFSKVLREELKSTQIRVTAVLPGATLTDSWRGTDEPIERFMQPDDIGNAVLNAFNMREFAVVEEMLLRPQKGDF